MLPREQVECFQRLVLFNQMIGRMIHASTRLAYETDYFHLLEEMRDRVKEVLHVQRSRIFGVDYNSLMARELWLVGGERCLGHAVSLDEWAGRRRSARRTRSSRSRRRSTTASPASSTGTWTRAPRTTAARSARRRCGCATR